MGVERGTEPGFRYRADVDGLRAIAVLSVIAFHALPIFVPGGFIGVDIFFVISGYLISSLILADLKDGSFSYSQFYARRVRRLFPALIVVLLATWALGLLVLLPVELAALGRQMLAAAAFAGNILNYFEAGYFDAPALSKPLLHLWSLGVEEQFYLVFPALLLALLRFRSAWLLLASIGVASFALNIGLIRDHASFTFYLPFTRFWEFVAGALLAPGLAGGAAWRLWSDARFGTAREILPVAGAVAIVASIVVATPETFPGWTALLPVLGTVLIIGAGPDAWLNRMIAGPKLVFIGLISYPLYLWHWPLIVAGRTIMQDQPNQYERTTAIIAVALAFALATLTYQFVERPIRERRPVLASRRIALRLAGCLAAIMLVGFATLRTQGFLFAYAPAVQALLAPLPFEIGAVDESAHSAGPLLVTYGDSHAGHLHPGLLRLQEQQPFRLVGMSWGRCSPLGDAKADSKEKCDRLETGNRRMLERHRPDIVLIAGFWSYYNDIGGLAGALRFFREIGARRIVVVGSVPYWPRPPQRLLFEAYRADPLDRIPDRLHGFDGGTAKIDRLLEAIASADGATFISAQDVLCNENGCLARLGDSTHDIVQVDRTHLSEAGSRYFISRIAARLFEDAPRLDPPRAQLESRAAD